MQKEKEVEIIELIENKLQVIKTYHQLKEDEKVMALTDTYINIKKKIEDGTIPSNLEDSEGYIYISCRNKCWALLKKRNDKLMTYGLENTSEQRYASFIDDPFEGDEIDEKLKICLDVIELPIDKTIFKLRSQGYTCAEIGKEVGYSEVHINTILKKLIKSIPKRINREYKGKIRGYIVQYDGNKNFEKSKKDIINKYPINRHNLEMVVEGVKSFDNIKIKPLR